MTKANLTTADAFLAALAEIAKPDQPWSADRVRAAWDYAARCHAGQARLSGEPYIIHPSTAALTIAKMGLDETSIIAALLHDTVEDSALASTEQIAELFGRDVLAIVEGVTKIKHLRETHGQADRSAENMRKLLLAMARDIRVIFVKLADRLHNMQTLGFQPAARQQHTAQETLDIYAPLAHRLGIGWIKTELEDLCLKHLDPPAYYDLKKRIEDTRRERTEWIEKAIALIRETLAGQDLAVEISGRAKHFYSIYRKMKTKEKPFEEIHDLMAVRIITERVPDCYQVLGIIHSLYRPLYDRFKDYIALPKSNMYSSLHTTIIGPDGRLLEIQIRTREMDSIAEEGAASHILYKASGDSERRDMAAALPWLARLKQWQNSLTDPAQFMQELKGELLQDEIYVFTPKGDVLRLVAGASPLDFAYAIHTDVGQHTIGARVNGRMLPLKTPLKNCDVVEILTSRSAHPTTAWLRIARSSRARHKIRAWLKSNLLDTEQLSAEIQRKEDAAPPRRRKPVSGIGPEPPKGTPDIVIDGEEDLLFEFAHCCNPQPGDAILGYISRGRGISIHRHDCPNIPNLLKEPGRIVYPAWKSRERNLRRHLVLHAADDPYLLPDIVALVAANNGGIQSVQRLPEPGNRVRIELEIECSSGDAWLMLLSALEESGRFSGIDALEPDNS